MLAAGVVVVLAGWVGSCLGSIFGFGFSSFFDDEDDDDERIELEPRCCVCCSNDWSCWIWLRSGFKKVQMLSNLPCKCLFFEILKNTNFIFIAEDVLKPVH